VLIGGPGTASSLLGLRYLAQGLAENSEQPVLLVSFGRDYEDFAILANNFPWFRRVMEYGRDAFHFLYYRPVNLDQNRLLYEIRKEVQTYHIDRVLIDSLSSLPLVDNDTQAASDFLVTLIGLLKELRCTAMVTYASGQSPEPTGAPGRFIPSLADNIFVLRNEYVPNQKEEMRKNLFILKARGTDAISQEVEFYIGEDLAVRPLKASLEHAHRENTR
jgi:KaiC/GvpD/RAD55 family RecA-like ATPase